MKKLVNSVLFTGFLLVSSSSIAGVCELTIDRKACPGQEKKALEPYNQKNPTVEKKAAANAAECKKKAEEGAKIVRKGTLAEKTVTAKFGTETIGPVTDKSPCESK